MTQIAYKSGQLQQSEFSALSSCTRRRCSARRATEAWQRSHLTLGQCKAGRRFVERELCRISKSHPENIYRKPACTSVFVYIQTYTYFVCFSMCVSISENMCLCMSVYENIYTYIQENKQNSRSNSQCLFNRMKCLAKNFRNILLLQYP